MATPKKVLYFCPIRTLSMRQISFLFLLSLLFTACSEQYSVVGRSTQSVLDGRMAYLRPTGSRSSQQTIDSCEVLHGQFSMSGKLDSVQVVQLYLGSDISVPIVLEEGEVGIDITGSSIILSGTPLNERLYSFLTTRDSLSLLRAELPRVESSMILEGYDEDYIIDYLGSEEMKYVRAIDQLETEFIKANYDNILGITWFLQLCTQAYRTFGYPTTTPQIDELYLQAPETFRQHPDVVTYMKACE